MFGHWGCRGDAEGGYLNVNARGRTAGVGRGEGDRGTAGVGEEYIPSRESFPLMLEIYFMK